jgi:hypothetical protein
MGQTIQWPKEEKEQTIQWPKEEKGQTIQWPKEEKGQTVFLACFFWLLFCLSMFLLVVILSVPFLLMAIA